MVIKTQKTHRNKQTFIKGKTKLSKSSKHALHAFTNQQINLQYQSVRQDRLVDPLYSLNTTVYIPICTEYIGAELLLNTK